MHVKLLIYLVFIYSSSLFAATNNNWSVNYWGSTPTDYKYLEHDQSCNSKNYPANSFLVNNRGNGGAELVYANKLTPFNAYNFAVGISSNKKTSVSVYFRRDEFPYETTAIQQLEVADRKLVNLKGIYTANSRGSVRIALADTGTSVCIDSPNLSTISAKDVGTNLTNQSLAKQHLIKEVFFGVHINKLGTHNNWPSFNPGILRLWDTGTTWSDMQPTPNAINWNINVYAKRLDYYINHGEKNNSNIQFIYTLAMTPNWAAPRHKTNCNNSSYGHSSCMAPIDLEDWRSHVKELANRYKGRITLWELWNEADQPSFWSGSPETMAKMAKITYKELKKIDSNNKLIGPNITILGMNYLSQFLKFGGGAYVDGFSIHSYVGRTPEFSLHAIRNLQQLLMDYDYDNKPIWNTETNVSCNSTLEDCQIVRTKNPIVLKEEIALAQGMLGNAALGVVNFTYHTWEGTSQGNGGQGLAQVDFKSLSNTGFVYSNIKSWIIGAQLSYLKAETNGINIVKIDRSGQQAFAVWSFKGSRKLNINLFPLAQKLMHATGKIMDITAEPIFIGEEPVLLFPQGFNLASQY